MKYINKFCSLILTLIFASTNTINSRGKIPLQNKTKLTEINSSTMLLGNEYSNNNDVQVYNFCQIISAVSYVSSKRNNDKLYTYCQNLGDLKNFIIKYTDSDICRIENEKIKISKSILDRILKSVSDLKKNKILEDNLYIREQNDICEIDAHMFDVQKTLFDESYNLEIMNDLDQLLNRLNKALSLFSTCLNNRSKEKLKIKEFQQNLKYIQLTVNDIDKSLISSKLHQILCNLRAIYKEININSFEALVLFTKTKILKLISYIISSFGNSPVSKQKVVKSTNEIRKLFNLKLINY